MVCWWSRFGWRPITCAYKTQPGTNAVKISIAGLTTSGTERHLNPATIARFMFFMVNPAKKHTLFVDYIRLCRQASGQKAGCGLKAPQRGVGCCCG